MGRSTTSCFNIISCAGSNDSVDSDEIHASSQNKGTDKRGWSFRKRSAGHRVLSNTIVTEIPSSVNKESSEPATITSEPQVNSSISEKTPDNIWTEEIPRLATPIIKDTTVPTVAAEAVCEDDDKSETVPDESAILVIQAAVRSFLARKELVKQKKIVKLQAAVRGHLVRNHAVGTLRCVQAIVKMQALVRARREKSFVEQKGVQDPGINSQPTHISIEKLLSNSLARQLLESTPRTKQINIKCEPLKSDSAWNWLERWMSVSTPETGEVHAPVQDQDKVNNESTENEIETVISTHHESTDMKSEVVEEMVPSEENDNLIHIEQKSYVVKEEDEKPQLENTCIPDSLEKPDSPPDEPMAIKTEAQIAVSSVPDKPVSETEPKRPAKRLATDQAESEGRKSVFGSRKASNPAFIAAQSRFEELTSKSNPLKSVNSSNRDNKPGSPDTLKPADSSDQDDKAGWPADVSHPPENATQSTDVEPEGFVVSHSSREVRNGGSECGTELSITSTLDSPDQNDVGNKNLEEEAKVVNEVIGDTNGNNNNTINIEEDVFPNSEKTHINLVMPEKHNDSAAIETEKPKSVTDFEIPQVEQKLEDSLSEADIELEPESGHQVYKSNTHTELETIPQMSSEASPRSHMTVPESQETPSSQVSINTKKTKSDKKGSSQKRKSWSTSNKKSPVRSSVDSGLRSSLEQLPKEPKSEKRRNSFGSPRSDHIDQEHRGSSSNSSLPSYMQATESARAKAITNSSPRSSPDVHDKETYFKKRHSLPGAAVNGRQGSPRIQRSMSQALQTAKGNGNQERKWQR